MHIRARIVAGTALALVMTAYAGASAQAGAPPPLETFRTHAQPARDGVLPGHLLLAQADEEVSEEERPREAEEAPAEEAAPEAPAAEQPAEEAPAQEEVQEEPAPEAPAAEEPAAEEPAAEEPAPEPPVEEPVQQEAPEEPAPAPEEPAAEEPAPAPEEPAAEQPAEETAPSGATEEAPAGEETDRAAEPVPGEPAPPQDAAPTPPTDAPVPPQQDAQPPADSGPEPVPGEPAPPQDAAPTPPAEDAPIPPEQDGQPPADSGVEPVTDDAPREAPILDSAKEDPAATGEQGEQENPPQDQEQPAEAAPPPASDQEAQRFEEPVEVQSLRAEEGRRIDRREEPRERREGASVLREIGDRVVIQLNNQVIVQSDDRGRIERDASEVYYEELPRGRTRETVVRPNGVQVVTVYDRYGDVIRRSRIMPDGREHVLVYAGDRDREGPREWRDPGLDLPPLRLAIPAEEYILDAGRVREEETYYDFLAQPPVDQVRRPYSVDEVRYSARVRDSVRRIDLDTITFDFGSATISEDAIPRLAGVADAMERLLERNPGEVFLIEGHTDAVGSDQANLALSDQRAESVATAMANVFGIPPENLVTQGYGERYLKINTQEPEQENRRVAIRRITPLVAPVASAE